MQNNDVVRIRTGPLNANVRICGVNAARTWAGRAQLGHQVPEGASRSDCAVDPATLCPDGIVP